MSRALARRAACLALVLTMALGSGSFAFAAFPPEQGGGYRLTVENIRQNPELPNGCEITALAIVLQYYGFAVAKTTLADEHLPKENRNGSHGPDPEESYVGNPRGATGWYCWPPVLVRAADSYLAAEGAGLAGVDITGAEAQLIQDYIDCHMPVVVWVTIDWSAAPRHSSTESWRLAGGDRYTPYTNVHCMVVTGYSEGVYYIANPLGDETEIDAATFMAAFEGMGSRAMVVGTDAQV